MLAFIEMRSAVARCRSGNAPDQVVSDRDNRDSGGPGPRVPPAAAVNFLGGCDVAISKRQGVPIAFRCCVTGLRRRLSDAAAARRPRQVLLDARGALPVGQALREGPTVEVEVRYDREAGDDRAWVPAVTDSQCRLAVRV